MPTYIMLSSLGPDGAARVVEQPERIYEVKAEVEAMGVTVIAQYATLGAFDFVNIIEAPDEKIMARVAMALASRGTLKTQTLTSIPVDEFVEALKTM